MINFKEALSLISNLAAQTQLGSEILDLELSDGRICDKDIFSPEAVPSFNNSAMDGFAICSINTISASVDHPLDFDVSSIIAAGDDISFYAVTKSGLYCCEIMTGAPVPQIFDAVVKIEDVVVHRNQSGGITKITINSPVPFGNNIRLKGSDYQIGQIVLQRGSPIRAESLMALASLGVSQVSVFSKPTVSILSTGKELVPLQTKVLSPGMIRNSTSIYLKSALTHLGAQVVDIQTMGDDITNFKNYVKDILQKKINILVTTGAVSMGIYDFIAPALVEMGAKIIFHKVAIRPGKPILLASLTGTDGHQLVIFGMPGNPVSSAVGLRFFLAPYFRDLNARGMEQSMPMKLSHVISKPKGLQCFYKARLERKGNGLQVNALLGQGSFMVSSLVQANAWVLFPEEGNSVTKEDDVLVYPLLPDQSFDLEDLS